MRIDEDEPRCMQMTVPSSEQASSPEGIPMVAVQLEGQRPSFSGFSEKVTAWQPFLATRRILSGCQLGIPDHRDADSGMKTGRARHPAPLVDVPRSL